jgi:hypothetical protein
MNYLKSFQLFEAYGVSEVTLTYNELITNKYRQILEQFLKEDSNLPDKSRGRKYQKVVEFDIEQLKSCINRPDWPKFPVSKLTIEYSLETLSAQEFKEEYTSSENKNWTTSGGCYDFAEDGSKVVEPIDDRTKNSIHLKLEIGAVIGGELSAVDKEYLLLEVESSVAHELNHGLEMWMRISKQSSQLDTSVTWASDVNRAKVKSVIWNKWYKTVSLYLYWTEPQEIRAIIQEAWPYVKKYDFETMKVNSPSWKLSKRMIEFSSKKFKQEITALILQNYPNADIDFYLRRIKNGLANELTETLESRTKPSITGNQIKNMTVDGFLDYLQMRTRDAGIRIQKKISKQYVLKQTRGGK